MESKNSMVRKLVAQGEYKSALQICKDWDYVDKSHRDILRLGYECLLYPRFYEQLGRDPETEYEKAVAVLLQVYGEKDPL